MNIEIQPFTETDIPQAMELKDSLGWNQTPEDWQRFLLLSPDGSFKAMRGDELVATAVAYVFDRVCWIGMVIVKEGCRHQGVGRQIVVRCLDYSAEMDCGLVVLDATREGVSLYSHLGFRPEFLVGTARGKVGRNGEGLSERGPQTLPDYGLRRIEAKDLDEIVSLEACALGAVREALLYHLIKQYPGRGFICTNPDGQLEGFILFRPGFHSHQVGPLIARGDEAAQLLLQAVFSELTSPGGEAAVALTVPMSNPGIQRFLRDRRLSVEPRLTRMSKGRKRLHAREDMVYALSGPEKG
ncbi:MAG: GNAT family N-acetyltransferase [Spirochaetaceae bacterium]|nr:MAG: GNAT family N-acetyltransferase [Spirochaetaceae bacterium]